MISSPLVVIGIDLAGVEKRPTGMCLLRGNRAETFLAYTDDEILASIEQVTPRIVGIDAPLSLPRGRRTIHDRNDVHLRECDRELLRHRIRFFPVTLGPMRTLTERGLRLKARIEAFGISAVEIYPGGAQDLLDIPRKQQGLDALRAGLRRLGIRGLRSGMTDHELDAVTGAFVVSAYLRGEAAGWGDPAEGVIIMPLAR